MKLRYVCVFDADDMEFRARGKLCARAATASRQNNSGMARIGSPPIVPLLFWRNGFVTVLTLLLQALVVGSLVYCFLTIVAARSYLRASQPKKPFRFPAISILTPLAGVDRGLEANLRSSFEQDYSEFEIVFGVRSDDDPAAAIACKMMAEFPHVP